MVIDGASLMTGLVSGSASMAYWVHGKKRHKSGMLWAGMALMVYPWFVDGLLPTIFIGVALLALPFFYRD